jgi:hypothetical protein
MQSDDIRTSATRALLQRLDDAVNIELCDREWKTMEEIYAMRDRELRRAWIVTLKDPIARCHVQLDALWSVSKSANEVKMTLLEILLNFCKRERRDAIWHAAFDAECRFDLIENLRKHAYLEAPLGAILERAFSWMYLFSVASPSPRRDLVHICQVTLACALGLPVKEDDRIRKPEFCPELAEFVVQVLVYALSHAVDVHLDTRQLFFAIAHSRGGSLLSRLVDIAHRYAPGLDEYGESLARVMVIYSPLPTLRKWTASTSHMDKALHSDWVRSSWPSNGELYSQLDWYRCAALSTTRRTHFALLEQRWITHTLPLIADALLEWIPADVVQHVILPFVDPLKKIVVM